MGGRTGIARTEVAYPLKCDRLRAAQIPLIHWLPRKLQPRLLRNFTVWGWMTRPDAAPRARFLSTTRMLTRAELQTLFPETEIWTERFLGLAKGFVAVKIEA